MKTERLKYCLFLSVITALFPVWALAQVDSSYIKPFDLDFSARIYTYDKFAGFDKENSEDSKKDFTYKTNNPISIGLGVAWKDFSISFSHGFNFFRSKGKGKTKSMEFKYLGYGRKFAYDLYIQRHKGFYDDKINEDGSYNLFSDVKLTMYGGSLQYIFNNKRFSYRAAFNQNERQLKSAGSLLAGGAIYYSKINSDSTSLFEGMPKDYETLQIGLTAGYAYTWVISRHWFLSGSFTGGVTIGNNRPNRFFKEKMRVYPILNGRLAVGYNADSWSIGSHFVMNRVYLFHNSKESLGMDNGQVQLTFIKRFSWGNKFVNKTLNQTNDRINKVKGKLRL